MPAVIVFSSPKGLPIAATHSKALPVYGYDEDDGRDTRSWQRQLRLNARVTVNRIADRHLGEPGRFDFQYGDVGALVHTDDLGPEFALVGKLDHDFARVIDDMRIGQNVAVGGEDEA